MSVLRLALLLAWMSDSFIESSFDELLKLREVTQSPEPTTVPTDKRTELPVSEEQAWFYYSTAG